MFGMHGGSRDSLQLHVQCVLARARRGPRPGPGRSRGAPPHSVSSSGVRVRIWSARTTDSTTISWPARVVDPPSHGARAGSGDAPQPFLKEAQGERANIPRPARIYRASEFVCSGPPELPISRQLVKSVVFVFATRRRVTKWLKICSNRTRTLFRQTGWSSSFPDQPTRLLARFGYYENFLVSQRF